MANVFITGITGLLGKYFAKELIKKGYNVTGLARNINDQQKEASVNYVQGDILDISLLNEHIQENDIVIHCAAKVSFNPKDKEQLFRTNHEGTENVVNACLNKKASKLLYVSSVAALGKPAGILNSHNKVMIDESQMWLDGPENSNYAKSKFLGETEVWRGHAEGLNVLVVNPSIIFGEDDWTQSSSRLFKYVWDKQRFQTAGFINYVDVKDVVGASLALLDKNSNDKYILNAGRTTLDSFFTMTGKLFGRNIQRKTLSHFWINVLWRIERLRSILTRSSPLITQETAISAQLDIEFSNEKVRKELQYEFIPLKTSLKRITKYYQKQAGH